ncbi:meiosis-specific coiled-coil domain-containing protein MEIOC-like [Mobula hypostoma]|uniref:meiosis-specific coiled-coil domain-containing protein MEIOC-like n=1 Tax=Mobula hypostoma TaxID=723540 RepID=UPI002FC33942
MSSAQTLELTDSLSLILLCSSLTPGLPPRAQAQQPRTVWKSVNHFCNGIDANSRSSDVFGDALVNCNSFFSPYKVQVPQYEENIDWHQSYTTSVSTTPDSSLFYVPWSTSGDDYQHSAGSQSNPNQSQDEMNEFGSAADLYKLVSDILEEPDEPQSLFVEGNASSHLLRSRMSSTTSRFTEHLDYSSESDKPVDASYALPVFNVNEFIETSDRQQYQQDNHLVPQRNINMEDVLRFDGLALTELWPLPSKKDTPDRKPFQLTDTTKLNFQEFPYVKNYTKLQVGLPVREPGTEMYISDFETTFEKQRSNYDHFSQQSEYVRPLNALPVSVYSGESYQEGQSWTNLATSTNVCSSETNTAALFGKPDSSADLENQTSVSKPSIHPYYLPSHQFSMPFPQNNAYFQRSTGIYNQDNYTKVPSTQFIYNIERAEPGTHIEGQNKASGEMYFESPIEKICQNGKQANENSSQQYFANKYPSYQTKQQSCHDLNEDMEKNDEFSQNMYREFLTAQSYYNNHNSQQGAQDTNDVANYITRSSADFSSPFMMGDFRQNHISQRGLLGVASGSNLQFDHPAVSLMDRTELISYEELSYPDPYHTNMFYGDVPVYGFVPPCGFPRPMKNRSNLANELHFGLEEGYEQWRSLEKERRKTEAALARSHPGKRVTSTNNTPIPRLPSNPSRVDRLIVDQLREQARVVALLSKMERVRSSPFHANISTAIARYQKAIHIAQARRKEEIVNQQRQGASRYQDDQDIFSLAIAIKEMAIATRRARTALWCAFQMTLPKQRNAKPNRRSEHDRE